MQKRGVKIPQKAQKVIKKYSKNFQKIGQSSDDVEGQSDPQENVENKHIKNDIEYRNEKEEEIFKQLMETRSKFQQKKNKGKIGENNGNAKDMTEFYRKYAKLIANKDPKKKDVGISPQFWKQIEVKTAENEIKMKNDEKKE
uniref:Uncharacterized protein n=1 Tax=Meloidogyne floridensis TaxID=298350 RepID=A0A915NL92_9BILA